MKQTIIMKIEEYCRKQELLQKNDCVLIGFSGGADSVCLFLALLQLQKRLALRLVPVHVHHNLRAAEADQDQIFCEEFCKKHGIPLVVRSVQVKELAKQKGWTLEEAGRYARYQVFQEEAEHFQCTKLAVAHHKNDQAETMLFQLFRGSRMNGLSGIKPKNDTLIRPLLCITRKEIEEYLSDNGQCYCTDSTNSTEEYTRNRIRHAILPEACKIQPQTIEHLAKTAEYLQRVENYLESETRGCFFNVVKKENDGLHFSITASEKMSDLIRERVIYQTLCEIAGHKKDITSVYVTMCQELIKKQTGREIILPDGIRVRKSYDELIFEHGNSDRSEQEETVITTFPFEWSAKDETLRLEFSLIKFAEKYNGIPKSTYTKWFDYDKMKNSISVRTPKQEDSIALFEDGRGKALLSVLKDYKVPKEKRLSTIVLAEGTQILWIPGIRSSEAYRISNETKTILSVTMYGGKNNGRQNQRINFRGKN